MRKKRLSKIIIITLIFVSEIYAKGGYGHSLDMLEVLGLYSNNDIPSSESNLSILKELFTKINDYCDKLNVINSEGASDNFYDQLRSEFNFFTYEKKYTHREIYHWGFNFGKDLTSEGIPSDNQIPEALKQTFERKFTDMYGDSEWLISEWHRFLKFIIPEQEKRNTSLTNYINIFFRLNSTNDARDIAAILYYIHLLGDHIEYEGEHSGEAVLELHKIEKNLDLHVKSLAKKCDWEYKSYKQAIKLIYAKTDRERAQKVLNCLKRYIPPILEYKYADKFAAINLIFIPNYELLNVS